MCAIPWSMPGVSCAAEPSLSLGLCIHSNESSSLPDYAEEALSGREGSCRGPSAFPFQLLSSFLYCTFHIKCPRPHPTLEVTLSHRELTILVTQKIW